MSAAAPRTPAQRLRRHGQLTPAVLAALLAACAGHPPHGARAPAALPERPPAGPAAETGDASYDWHVLVPAPFGTKFKDMPLPLHEVLLFHDQSPGAPEDAECYSSDAPAPQFVGRSPDEHLLCFRHDHLARVRASVTLDGADGAATAQAVCARWTRNAQATAGTQPPPAAADTLCDGIDGGVHFSARLGTDAPPVLAVTLDSLSAP